MMAKHSGIRGDCHGIALGIAGVLFFIWQLDRCSPGAVSYIDIVMTSSLEMIVACWMSSWCGCPWHTAQYLPLCSRGGGGGGGPCLHTCYFQIPCFTSTSFVTRAHKKAPRRFHTTWWRIVRLSVDAIVHCFSKNGVLLSVWVRFWTRLVYRMSESLTRCFDFLLSKM
jgi:hypothetical protein